MGCVIKPEGMKMNFFNFTITICLKKNEVNVKTLKQFCSTSSAFLFCSDGDSISVVTHGKCRFAQKDPIDVSNRVFNQFITEFCKYSSANPFFVVPGIDYGKSTIIIEDSDSPKSINLANLDIFRSYKSLAKLYLRKY